MKTENQTIVKYMIRGKGTECFSTIGVGGKRSVGFGYEWDTAEEASLFLKKMRLRGLGKRDDWEVVKEITVFRESGMQGVYEIVSRWIAPL